MRMETGEVSYHVEMCGSGFPLVLLHGFTGDSSTWTPFCDKWGGHSRLIIPDIIGHGKTDSPHDASRYQIESAARDIKEILDQLGIKQIDLLGYSMGGRLALTFAILFPEYVRKLILESSSPGLRTEEERKQRRMKDAELAEFIIEKGIKPFVDHWEKIPLFSTMQRLSPEINEIIRRQRLGNTAQGLANSLLGMGTGSQPSWWERLHDLSAEVLLVTGKEDTKFCGIAEKMAAAIKNVTWLTVENSGHTIHVEETEKFGTMISDFLSNNL